MMDILKLWKGFSLLPGGSWMFSRAIGLAAPYSGSIGSRITYLGPGRCQMQMRDRRAVRNPFRSIHAVALVNLGELALNLALMTLKPKEARFIVTGLSATYHKKARGLLRTDIEMEPPDWNSEGDFEAECDLLNSDGEVVTTVSVSWKVGPVRK